ncbi:MAG: hypothetical protein VX938_14095, partial [Myxococcota bacterium]|nr:hypothetical protein [Myxococcota bacterium]
HIYADTQCAVSTRCEDCHGTIRVRAEVHESRPHIYTGEDGQLYLRTKVKTCTDGRFTCDTDDDCEDGQLCSYKELRIPQTIDSVTPGNDDYNPLAEMAMGEHDGFSHTDEMECYTCHAGWIPSCYGCHVDLDMTESKAYQTTGEVVPGRPTGSRRWVNLYDMVLMRNSEGKMALSMPAERFFMSVTDWLDGDPSSGEKAPVYDTKPRTFVREDGTKMAGFGQRAFNPHTTRRRSQFMACDRCHTVGDPVAPDNEALLDITHGFGSERFLQEGCDVTNDIETCGEDDRTIYRVDAIQTKDGDPLVVVGHPDPMESRPLTLDEINAMRAVTVPDSPPYSTQIPDDAVTNPDWPGPLRME